MIFYRPRLMRWNNNAITDHNRSELGIDFTEIGTDHRTLNGTARSYIVTRKRKFDVSWTDLPHNAANTVDNFWGGREMEQFYLNNKYFTLEITNGDNSVETFPVRFESFSRNIKKRSKYDIYDISVGMEQA